MAGRIIHDNSDPSLTDDAFEEQLDLLEDETAEIERDLATEELYDNQHSDGHTYNPHDAWEHGLVYTPPTDPAVLPSNSLEGISIAAGFGQSMETAGPDEEALDDEGETEASISNNDLELQNDVYVMLRNNSETQHLTDVAVQVRDGIVTLLGSVPTDDDIGRTYELISDMNGVADVRSRLTTEDF